MVKPTDARECDDRGPVRRLRFDRSPRGRIAERGMDALRVVVLDVLLKEASQVTFAKHHNVIEKLPADAADEALRRPVLPGTSIRRALGVDAEVCDRGGHFGREDRIVVEDEESMQDAAGFSVTLKWRTRRRP